MVITARLVDMLRCPADGTPLRVADQSTIDSLNAAIDRRAARDRAGQVVAEPVESGLVAAKDAKWLYPIRHGIPSLVIEEAISLKTAQES